VVFFWIGERGDKAGIGPDGIGGTTDDQPPGRPVRLIALNTRTGAVQVLADPKPSGTPPAYTEVYGPVLQLLGDSAPLVPEWERY
jgi:hypothetical protein